MDYYPNIKSKKNFLAEILHSQITNEINEESSPLKNVAVVVMFFHYNVACRQEHRGEESGRYQ